MSPRLAPTPLVSFALFKNRTVVAGCIIAFFYFMVFFLSVQPYFYSYLVVARNLSPTAAGHICQIFSFSCTITILTIGVIIKYVKRYKPFLLAGMVIYTLGIFLMFQYRNTSVGLPVIVVTQLLVGIGGGFINVPTQLGIQASVNQQNVGCATAIFLTLLSLGGAMGSAISGALWSTLLKRKLGLYLPGEALPALESIFGDFVAASAYEMGSPERMAIIRAYDETMKQLLIVALVACVPMWPCALAMKGLDLGEVEKMVEERGVVIGKSSAKEVSGNMEEVDRR